MYLDLARPGGRTCHGPRKNAMSLTILLRCSDLGQTRDFYRTALGFRVTETAKGTLTARFEGSTLLFTDQDLWKTAPAVSGTIYFATSDADSYYAVVKDKVPVSWPLQEMPYGSREFGIRDCNGYSLAFQTAVVREIDNIREQLMVRDADLTASRFSNIKLAESIFLNVNMHRSSFSDAKLTEASFVDVDLAGASIEASNLTGMRVNGVLLSDLIRAYQNRG
jgi:catechol 2,3-dioxygenase-like lactoylglutathione lyase family enzyme